MRRPPLAAVLAAVVAAVLLTTTATAKTAAPKRPVAAKKKNAAVPAVPALPRVARGLETIVQDDGLMLYRPAEEVKAAVARIKALGIDRVRITASWSSLTRGADLEQKPEFDARDPAAYEQSRWQALDTAIRAINAGGLKALVDIGFWAPPWATTDPGPRARANIDPQAYADFAAAVALRYSGAFAPTPDPAGEAVPATPDQDLLQSLLQPLVPFPVPPLLPPPAKPPPPPPPAPSVHAAQLGTPDEPLPRVNEFILWNEPNHQGLLLPQWEADRTTPASPRVYRAMVRAAYAAVKSVRRSAMVLIGNTSSTGGGRGAGPVAPLEFLRDLACVDRNLNPRSGGDCAGYSALPGDGWAHHPYAQNERPSRVSLPKKEPDDLRLADTPLLARTLNTLVKRGRLAPGNRNIYLTEFGYETKGIPGRPHVDELKQARWLTWAEYLADRVPTVRSFAQFLLRDQPPSPTRVSQSAGRPFGEYSTGLLNIDGTDKLAAKTFLAGLFAQKQPKGRVLLYGRLRLGAGRKTVQLQRRRPRGRWQQLLRLRIDGEAAFSRTIRHVPGSTYRLTYPEAARARQAGIAIKPVAAAR
ncbi:MAG TPA: hypothetical protein VF526_11380 [Solirubrobacteraceae bacterium]|jgi:hypothetical protein